MPAKSKMQASLKLNGAQAPLKSGQPKRAQQAVQQLEVMLVHVPRTEVRVLATVALTHARVA